MDAKLQQTMCLETFLLNPLATNHMCAPQLVLTGAYDPLQWKECQTFVPILCWITPQNALYMDFKLTHFDVSTMDSQEPACNNKSPWTQLPLKYDAWVHVSSSTEGGATGYILSRPDISVLGHHR